MRQEVHWVPESRLVPLTGKPKRVWTLVDGVGEPTFEHKLPMVPKHHDNAFLEDHIHDWVMHNGSLRYFSRVALNCVWILVEFEEP